MEKPISDELKCKFDKLKAVWDDCTIEEISGTDKYYTDGAAAEAEFKIVFKQRSVYITSVFVMKNGDWFTSDYKSHIPVKTVVNNWINRVRSDMLACKLGIPSLPTDKAI